MIDLKKQYKTRDGREVKLYTTIAKHPRYPVHGVVNNEIMSWTAEGRYLIFCQSAEDLIEVKPVREGWLNIFPGYAPYSPYYDPSVSVTCGSVWPSKEIADKVRKGRIACIKIQFTEGEGL